MRLRPCTPSEVWQLLPQALTGGAPIAPVAELSPQVVAALRVEEPVTEPEAAVVVSTSGSTGTPKQVVLSSGALLASARATQNRIGALRWANPLPTHYVAGLMVLVRSLVAETSPIATSGDLSDLPDPEVVGDAMATSLVPTQLHRALRDHVLTSRLSRYSAILLGGAPADAHTLTTARERGLNVITTYGMSETCGGCVYDGSPLEGVEIQIRDERVEIGGPMLFSGYRLQPELTAASLVNGHLITHDRGEFAEGHLRILGRSDDVIITGGVNVDLAIVQRHLSQLDSDALVVAVPDADWGQRVVLVSSSAAKTLDEWRSHLRAKGLESAALPKQLIVPDRLPRTTSGKIDRQQLIREVSRGDTGTVG